MRHSLNGTVAPTALTAEDAESAENNMRKKKLFSVLQKKQRSDSFCVLCDRCGPFFTPEAAQTHDSLFHAFFCVAYLQVNAAGATQGLPSLRSSAAQALLPLAFTFHCRHSTSSNAPTFSFSAPQ